MALLSVLLVCAIARTMRGWVVAWGLALIGVGIGLGGVYLLGRLLHSTLYGVNSVDVGSFAVVVVSLLGVAVLASYVPARRSAKIDPMIALRQD